MLSIGEFQCPEWHDDIAAERLDQFRGIVAQVHRHIRASAGGAVLAAGDAANWHGALFQSFVPVEYYAGHYRGVDEARPCLAVDVQVAGCRAARINL